MAGASAAWGIDIGVSGLKAIKLRKDGDRVTVEAFDVIEHDKFLTEPDVDRDMMIRSTLQKFMSKYAVRRDVVYIGVPGSMTFARFVKLPPVETKKIPEIVRFEAIQQIPFPLDQVNWDYHTFQHPDSPDVEVGIFAMKKELVAQVMSNFQAVDMPVQGVQMSPLAVYNAAAYDGMTANKGTVVIDMGAEHTDLVIMDQGRLWLRTINIGGNHFTDALSKSFKQSFTRAEGLKKGAATSKYQKQIYQAMRPIFADLVAEIQRSIGHYSSSHRDSHLERIVGLGSPFKLPNLQKYLQQELKLEVIRLDSYAKANVEKAAAFGENILAMTAAYGLAVQALGLAPIDTNLLPTEIARKMMWRKKQPWFIGATALLALGSIGLGAQWWMARSAYAAQDNQLIANKDAMAKALAKIGEWKAVPDTHANDQTQIEQAMKLAENRSLWPSLTLDIYGALPQANGQKAKTIVITGINSEYNGRLSSVNTNSATPGAPVDPMAVAADPNVPPRGMVGDSDHGFIVTISGYTQDTTPQAYKIPKEYEDALMRRAPIPVVATAPAAGASAAAAPRTGKPYYFSSAWSIGTPVRLTAVAGGNPFGGAASSSTEKMPWGSVKGPYWEIFVPELTGLKPPAQATGGGGGMFGQSEAPGVLGELPYPVDMTQRNAKGEVKSMQGAFRFKLTFKVHAR